MVLALTYAVYPQTGFMMSTVILVKKYDLSQFGPYKTPFFS